MIRAVLFDLDGLLVDSEPLHYRSWKAAVAEVGVDVDHATYRDHWTRDGLGIREYVEKQGVSHDLDALRAHKMEIYQQLVRDELTLMPGAMECLGSLRGHKKLALVTSSYRQAVAPAMGKFGLDSYFDTVVTRHDVSRVKPSPEALLLAASRLNVAPHECVMVEDAEKGIRAAQAAGMFAIAVPTVDTQHNDFLNARVVNSLLELDLALVNGMISA